jgi:hypothetical protein
MPPKATAGTAPIHAASMPDLNSPSWFEVLMKIALTAPTRPRMSSGVSSCTRLARMTMLTMSKAPSANSAASDNHNTVDKANTSVATPKPATAANLAVSQAGHHHGRHQIQQRRRSVDHAGPGQVQKTTQRGTDDHRGLVGR